MSASQPLILFTIILALLWSLSNLFARHLQGLLLLMTGRRGAASTLYDLLMLPGVVLHEAAHIVMATLLGVRVLRVDLFRFRRRGESRQGEVIVAKVDALRMSLIGVAPLVAGILAALLILRALDLPQLTLTREAVFAFRPVLREPLNLIGVYLLWGVSNAMFPSASDRAAWWIVGVVIVVVATLGGFTGLFSAIPPEPIEWLQSSAAQLSSGLLPVLVLDIVLLVVVVSLEWLAGRITGRRVVHGG